MRAWLWLAALAASPAAAEVESVFVVKFIEGSDEHVIVERANGDSYLLELGVGCLSVWRYEGGEVLIRHSGLFDGVGTELLLPDDDEQCTIWESDEIERAPTWRRDTATVDAKTCSKGKPCGGTCIAIEKVCHIDDVAGLPQCVVGCACGRSCISCDDQCHDDVGVDPSLEADVAQAIRESQRASAIEGVAPPPPAGVLSLRSPPTPPPQAPAERAPPPRAPPPDAKPADSGSTLLIVGIGVCTVCAVTPIMLLLALSN